VELDAVITAEQTGAYKPDIRMFRRALETVADLEVKPRDHLHVAQSLFHDIVPAQALGIATCWIDRRAGRPGGAAPEPDKPIRPDHIFTTVEGLADAIDAAAEARAAAARRAEEENEDSAEEDVAPPRF
jgi:FMN phosphatase YigB (HAD superfamily)